MYENFMDSVLEAYDIFAGGDPNRPKSERYTSDAAKENDENAVEKNKEIEDPDSGNDESQNQNNDNSDIDEESGEDTMSNDSEDDMMGGENPDENSQDSPQNNLNAKNIETLFEMIVCLHAAISGSIISIEKLDPPLDETANRIYFTTLQNLKFCKDKLYEAAVYKLYTTQRVDLLRKVTAISKIYELSILSISKLYKKRTS